MSCNSKRFLSIAFFPDSLVQFQIEKVESFSPYLRDRSVSKGEEILRAPWNSFTFVGTHQISEYTQTVDQNIFWGVKQRLFHSHPLQTYWAEKVSTKSLKFLSAV